MIQKPSITIGILPDGSSQVLEVGDAELCKQAFLAERETPSGKFVDLFVYRKPPYWKRAKLSTDQAEPAPKKKASKKSA